MKKLLLSSALVISFAFYVFISSLRPSSALVATAQDAVQASASSSPIPTASTPVAAAHTPPKAPVAAPAPAIKKKPLKAAPSRSLSASAAPASGTAGAQLATAAQASSGRYKDGTYTGPATDAYFGTVQVQATISDGDLSNVAFLQYPSDRRTSQQINSQAMPALKSEAISAQSAKVDIVSGATQTSQAFIQSLRGALAQAAN